MFNLSRRACKFSPYDTIPCTPIICKYVLTIYYPDGRVERQGEYDTWYEANLHRGMVEIILDGIDAEYEITKERSRS